MGKNGILVVIHGADRHTSYSGPTDVTTGYATSSRSALEISTGVVQFGLGVSRCHLHRAFT